jgi:hypothetical protein
MTTTKRPKPAKKGDPIPRKHSWIVPGALANYHPIIDRPECRPVTVRTDPAWGTPYVSHSGSWVVFVTPMSGYVLCDALTPRKEDARAAEQANDDRPSA